MADATHLTVGSEWLAAKVPSQHHNRLSVIPLGVDTGMFSPAPQRSGRRLLAVASLQSLKDYPTLLRAVSIARRSLPTVSLTIAGYPDPVESERLRGMVAELGLGDVVTFHGEVPHDSIPSLLAGHDLLLHASLWEAQGMVILEALATGMPVVSSRVGIAAELPASLVRTFVPRDADAMADLILDSLADDAHARVALAEGPALVKHCYSLDVVSQRFMGLYRSLLHQHGPVVEPTS
jgi:glycosyltransferase involved in cell wall biosynthesis